MLNLINSIFNTLSQLILATLFVIPVILFSTQLFNKYFLFLYSQAEKRDLQRFFPFNVALSILSQI